MPADTGHGGWRFKADSATTKEEKKQEEEEEEEEVEEEKADIKSNNPHLTGGELKKIEHKTNLIRVIPTMTYLR